MMNMDDYKNAMNRIEAPDSMADALFSDAENKVTRRIEKHSAWMKPAAAAAVAAVVGLNVFAVMKLRQNAGTITPGAPGSSETSELSLHFMPDLSAFGIDTGAFSLKGVTAEQEDAEWFYSGSAPAFTRMKYENEGKDLILLDDANRIVRYERNQGTVPGEVSERSAEEIAEAFIKAVLSDGTDLNPDLDLYAGKSFDLKGGVSTAGGAETALYSCMFTQPDGTKGTATVMLSADGVIHIAYFTYYTTVEDETGYRAEAERLVRENFDPDYSIMPDSRSLWYIKIGDTVYGIWHYNDHAILVCASNPDAETITADTPDFSALSDGTFTLDYVGEDPLRNVVWCYSSDLPTQPYYMYRCAETEEEIYTDAQGRITRYLSPNLAVAAIIPDADALSSKAEQLAKDVTGAAKAEALGSLETTDLGSYSQYKYVVMNEDDEIFAEVMVELMGDGGVRTYLADYIDWDGAAVTDEQAAAFQQEADRLVADEQYDGAGYCWYIQCGGTVYAKYLPNRPSVLSRGFNSEMPVEDGRGYSKPLLVSLSAPVDDEPVKTLSPSVPAIEFFWSGTDFVKSETPYTGGEQGCINDMQINGYWCYDAARPTEEWTEYVHTDGMRIVTDPYGNIRRMFNKRKAGDPDKTYTNEEIAQREETFRLSAESNVRDAQKILAAAYPGTTWEVDLSTIWDMDVSLFEIIFVRTENGAKTRDKAYFYFDQDGDIDTFSCDMVEVGAQVPVGAQAAFDEEAARILDEKFHVTAENIEGKYFDLFGGSTYGFYQFTDAAGSEATLIVDLPLTADGE